MNARTRPNPTSQDIGLALADGQRWVIRTLDEQAAVTVRTLGQVMQLGPAQGGRMQYVASGFERPGDAERTTSSRFVCRLGPGRERRTERIRMERVASAIAAHSLARKGILLHGALASRDGAGFILAGPSGVGKTTASRCLPPPWQSLSDDCTLVVRDAGGRYWAHAWPTWSRLRGLAPAASWPVEQAVPLKALFFLRQSPADRTEPVAITPAAALIVESAFQLGRTVVLSPSGRANRTACRRYLQAAWALAAAVPAFRLHVSRNGHFWHAMERALSPAAARAQRTAVPAESGPGLDRPRPRRRCTPQVCPVPPCHLLPKGLKPKLVCFKTRDRTFLKLVTGRRVVASANDLLREWYVPRAPRRP